MLSRLLALMLVTVSAHVIGQISTAERGFKMEAPDGWRRVTNELALQNLRQFVKLTPEELQRILATEQGSIHIVTYSKEPLETDAVDQPEGDDIEQTAEVGLIPKITVHVTRNPTKTFDEFFAWTSRGAERLKSVPGFAAEPLRVVQVGGRRSVVILGTSDVPVGPNLSLKARSRTYFIPVGDAAYQIDFTDTPADDCTNLFDRLVATVRFD